MSQRDECSIGGRLVLQDEGVFFVNGRVVETPYPRIQGPAGAIVVNQMYVHFRIPETITGPPLILIHGSIHTGAAYETTPDGREGWATYFARFGFPVYVVDCPGRGRSGFNSSVINRAKIEGNADMLPGITMVPRELSWVNLRFGPEYDARWPDLQFPADEMDHYGAQIVPNAESTLEDGNDVTVNALASLLERIGPAIVVAHSQSGSYGMELAVRCPKLVRAFVNIEGDCTPFPANVALEVFRQVPLLSLWGDHSVGAPGYNGDARRNECARIVNLIQAENGPATLMVLPDSGINGNSHMLMMDKNNLMIADMLMQWLESVLER